MGRECDGQPVSSLTASKELKGAAAEGEDMTELRSHFIHKSYKTKRGGGFEPVR
jgi:hypothetical protein